MALNSNTLSICFHIKWWIAWHWGKRFQFPVNCNSRIKELCNLLETFCNYSLKFLLPSSCGSKFHDTVPHSSCFKANGSKEGKEFWYDVLRSIKYTLGKRNAIKFKRNCCMNNSEIEKKKKKANSSKKLKAIKLKFAKCEKENWGN